MPLKHTGLKVIALDFDGTLVESNLIKDRAFKTIFSEWPEQQEIMMRWHLSHNAIDRREKFRYFVEEVLGLHDRDDLIAELTKRFSMLTRQAIIDCPFVKGAQDFLEYIYGKVTIHLVSATPLSEIIKIIKNRGLECYFKDVYGGPINKLEILKKIMMSEKASADETLFIGDSPEDKQAATSLGIHFIGRQSDRCLDVIEDNIFSDFFKIKDYSMKFCGLS